MAEGLGRAQGSESKDEGLDLESAALLYSICTELFVEKVNFRGLVVQDPSSGLRDFGPFSPRIYDSFDQLNELPNFMKWTF